METQPPDYLPEEWEEITASLCERFEHEYALEIAKGHGLYGVPVRAVAKRKDCDDVLFRLLRHLCKYSIVHLTWSGKEEKNIDFPRFELFADDDHLKEGLGLKPPKPVDENF